MKTTKDKRFLGLVRHQSGLESKLAEELSYRLPMPVTETFIFRDCVYGWTGFAVCPRCRVSMEREYMSFCDRCGQRLNWTHYAYVKSVFSGEPHR